MLTHGPFVATLLCNPLNRFSLLIIRGLSGKVGGAPVRCTFAFHPLRTTGVARGLDKAGLAELAASRTSASASSSQPEDRIIYREYAQRAAAASRASGMQVFGLHLLMNADQGSEPSVQDSRLEGATGFGISKFQRTGPDTFVLGRDYCLRLDNGVGKPIGELMILFETDVQCTSEDVAKLQLSRIAPYLDRVAASVKYHGIVGFAMRAYVIRTVIFAMALLASCLATVHWLAIAPAFGKAWMLYGVVGFVGVLLVGQILREMLSRRFLWPTFQIQVKSQE